MDAIKSYMLRHGLHSGDRLPTESALCTDLGVSRSSVREALRRLEALDIVTVRQGSGSYVGNMSMQPLVETLILRASLDAAEARPKAVAYGDVTAAIQDAIYPAIQQQTTAEQSITDLEGTLKGVDN